MGIQINGATDSITAIDGTIDVVSAIGNAGVVTATAFVGNITGNVTGNINHTSNLELQTGGVTRASITSSERNHPATGTIETIAAAAAVTAAAVRVSGTDVSFAEIQRMMPLISASRSIDTISSMRVSFCALFRGYP